MFAVETDEAQGLAGGLPWPVFAGIVVVIVYIVVFGSVGRFLGEKKGNGRAGFWLGALLGPIGLLIAVLLPRSAEAEAAFQSKVDELRHR